MEARSERLAARIGRATAARPATFAFAGVFVTCLLAFLGLGAVLPVLPRYVKGPIGSTDVAVGLVTGAFAFTAVVCRPLGGRLADTRGRRLVVMTGALLSSLAGALYFLPLGVPGLVLARLVLGAGEGLVFTAGAAWTVDLAPEETRGRSIGLFGLTIWSALTAGPLIGELLRQNLGYDAVWAFAAGAPLVGALVARSLPASPRPAAAQKRGSLVAREALRPGVSLSLAAFGQAAFAGFIVLHLDAKGIGHGAAIFTAFGAAVVGARVIAGRLPDVVGPRKTAVGAALCEACGLAVIGFAGTLGVALVGAVIMGFGFSVLFPSLALIVVNAAGEDRRGAALGTFTAFFDIGMGLGGLTAGAIAALSDYPEVFWFAAGCAALGAGLAAAASPRARGVIGDIGIGFPP
jgi:MFS family permease